MGWTVHYQLVREAPLTQDEIAATAALNLEAATTRWDGDRFALMIAPAPRADHVLGEGLMDLPMGDSDDAEQLEGFLERMLGIAAGAELRVRDDFGAFGWDPTTGAMSGGKRTPAPLRVERGELVDPKTLAPQPLPPLGERVAALVTAAAAGAVAAEPLDDEVVAALFATLPTIERDDPRRPAVLALLAAVEPDRAVRLGFAGYGELATCYDARDVLWRAIDRLGDPVALVDAFLEVWRNPRGVYYYGDLPVSDRFRDAVAPVPAVVEQMIADVEALTAGSHDDDLAGRRAEHAVGLLARGRTERGLQALLAMIGHWRDRPKPWRIELGMYDTAHEQLARHGDGRAFATLVHFLGTMAKDHRAHRAVLEALPRLDPVRARPHVLAVADLGAMPSTAVTALAALGGEDAHARLRELARHPERGVRTEARRALTAAGLEPGPEPEAPPAEALVLHPDRDVRHRALRELHDRKDRALMLSLCAAEEVDAILRARSDDSGLPFSWHEWDDLLSPAVRQLRPGARRAWVLGEGAGVLGPQVRLPAIEPVLATDAATVAATIPSTLYRLPDAVLAELRAEEAALLASLASAP